MLLNVKERFENSVSKRLRCFVTGFGNRLKIEAHSKTARIFYLNSVRIGEAIRTDFFFFLFIEKHDFIGIRHVFEIRMLLKTVLFFSHICTTGADLENQRFITV